jgi:exodeoxyribonuclease-1
MATSFFFYDLETTGFDARNDRIMQFAGVRTDMQLQPVGEPVNIMIKLTPDTLPSPDAIMVTGITPQQTIADGVTESEFLRIFYEEVVQPNTIFVGFNSIRFDDKFMQFLNYRNYYDAYEWRWKDGCSQWDILDVVRMTRALRPDGIEWPFTPEGKPTNRLELITSMNGLDHENAHDALNDVYATIAVAKLIRDKNEKLFDYLLKLRDKKEVAEIVKPGVPFVYTSGRYPGETLHTTVAVQIARHPEEGTAFVYDLRHDPTPFFALTPQQMVEAWRFTKDPDVLRLPVKTVKLNHCPAVAPLSVIHDAASQERIGLNMGEVTKNLEVLKQNQAEFTKKLLEAVLIMDKGRSESQTGLIDDPLTVDGRLYEGFFTAEDKNVMRAVRIAKPETLTEMSSSFRDNRLRTLLPLYKARNYPVALSSEERAAWDMFCAQRLFDGGQSSRLAQYFVRLQELAATKTGSKEQYLLEELQLYGQSIVPADSNE